MDDLTLARRVLAGDEAAFEEFFERYFPRLYRFALPRLDGSEDASEEVVQRVLIRAVHSLRSYRGEAALLTWLCTMCRREISSFREREGKRREVSLFDDHADIRAALDMLALTDADDPESCVRRAELAALVQSTLDHLPGRYGDVLEWKYILELSVNDIAQRLGVGYKAAESMLTRARAAFREGFPPVAGDAAFWRPRPATSSEES
jgi:RNA polymerase sigma-70 factor, ECF subfamily